jgi:hypothetical protein
VSLVVDLRRDPLRQRTLGPVRTSTEVLGTVPFTNRPATGAIDIVQPVDTAQPTDTGPNETGR